MILNDERTDWLIFFIFFFKFWPVGTSLCLSLGSQKTPYVSRLWWENKTKIIDFTSINSPINWCHPYWWLQWNIFLNMKRGTPFLWTIKLTISSVLTCFHACWQKRNRLDMRSDYNCSYTCVCLVCIDNHLFERKPPCLEIYSRSWEAGICC